MVIVIIFLVFIRPNILMIYVFQITQTSLSAYLGPYSTVIAALESTLCGLIYSKTLSRKKLIAVDTTSPLRA